MTVMHKPKPRTATAKNWVVEDVAARTFRVDSPVCASQLRALSALEEFGDDGSNFLTLRPLGKA